MAIQKITAAVLGNNAVTAANVAAGTLSAADIADNSITAAKISASTSPTFGGLTVDGNATISTADNNAQLTLISTDTDALVGPRIDLFRNSSSPANGDLIGEIQFQGEDSIGVANTYATISGKADQVDNGAEDGSLSIKTLLNGTLDTRVFIGGSLGRVGIGTTSPSSTLDVAGTIRTSSGTQSNLYLSNAAKTTGFLVGRSFASDDAQDFFIYDITAASTRLGINSSGNVGIGTTAPTGVRTKIKGLAEATTLATSATSAALFIEPYSGSSWGLGIGSISGQKQYIQGVSAAGDSSRELLLNPYGANVGIGTTTAVANLHISGAANNTYLRIDDGTEFLHVGVDSTGIFYNSNTTHRFLTNSGGTECLNIDSSGYIGISNTVASTVSGGYTNLVIGSGTAIDSGLSIYNNTSGTGRIHFADGTSAGDRYDGFIAYKHNTRELLIGAGTAGSTVAYFSQHGFHPNPSDQGSSIAANALDDYEYGTYSHGSLAAYGVCSAISQGSFANNYVKVGKLITIHGQFSCSFSGAGLAIVTFFVPNLGMYQNASAAVLGTIMAYPKGQGHMGIVLNNTSANNTQWYGEFQVSSSGTNQEVFYTVTYRGA